MGTVAYIHLREKRPLGSDPQLEPHGKGDGATDRPSSKKHQEETAKAASQVS